MFIIGMYINFSSIVLSPRNPADRHFLCHCLLYSFLTPKRLPVLTNPESALDSGYIAGTSSLLESGVGRSCVGVPPPELPLPPPDPHQGLRLAAAAAVLLVGI